MGLTIQNADANQLLGDTYFCSKQSTLVIKHIPIDTELREKLRRFIDRLSYNTELRLILVFGPDETNDAMKQKLDIPIVEMNYMDRK